ncbi:MAG TPA: HAMP domain-containing sensor histidine kinase [Burkholderiaceae bacterium]|nr:HAMP domain-containing sensor histidine kinase [Burkholderiaceae bacterium]
MPRTPPPPPLPWRQSLQARVLAATLGGMLLALALAGGALHHLFRQHVEQQFVADLSIQLHQVLARLEDTPTGTPTVNPALLSDPRWTQPYGGLYWQLQRPDGAVVQRSRSLWDQTLDLPHDTVPNGEVHRHLLRGPDGQPLLALEQTISRSDTDAEGQRWTLAVAASTARQDEAVEAFSGVLFTSLSLLALLLSTAVLAQLWFGLAPLRALERALQRVNAGSASRLEGQWPTEVQPLADGFNQALTHLDHNLQTARTQAGNLAHALKTPLAVLRQAADHAPPDELPQQVHEQVDKAQRQVDWHLRRARSAALAGMSGPASATAVEPVLQGLLRVMGKVHAARALHLGLTVKPGPERPGTAPLAVAVDEQDLHEMLGNLLDNACQWARTRVEVTLSCTNDEVRMSICDDGPGIGDTPPEQLLQRGMRLDESTPGSGLGLSIVHELATLYQGQLRLSPVPAPAQGLCVVLELPRA